MIHTFQTFSVFALSPIHKVKEIVTTAYSFLFFFYLLMKVKKISFHMIFVSAYQTRFLLRSLILDKCRVIVHNRWIQSADIFFFFILAISWSVNFSGSWILVQFPLDSHHKNFFLGDQVISFDMDKKRNRSTCTVAELGL